MLKENAVENVTLVHAKENAEESLPSESSGSEIESFHDSDESYAQSGLEDDEGEILSNGSTHVLSSGTPFPIVDLSEDESSSDSSLSFHPDDIPFAGRKSCTINHPGYGMMQNTVHQSADEFCNSISRKVRSKVAMRVTLSSLKK